MEHKDGNEDSQNEWKPPIHSSLVVLVDDLDDDDAIYVMGVGVGRVGSTSTTIHSSTNNIYIDSISTSFIKCEEATTKKRWK
jgi:hypothetical protein